MKHIKSKKLFENKENNYIYITDNDDDFYFTNDITNIPFLINNSTEDTIKNIKPLRNYYMNDKYTQYYSFDKKYHVSVGNNGWLEKSTHTYKISGRKITNDTFQILYLCDDNDNPINFDFNYMIINDETKDSEIKDFFKEYIGETELNIVKNINYPNYYIIEGVNEDDGIEYVLKLMTNIQSEIIKDTLNSINL